jgi:hypothetical protein
MRCSGWFAEIADVGLLIKPACKLVWYSDGFTSGSRSKARLSTTEPA